MKHLVVYSHPNPKSFNHAILETFVDEVKSKGGEVRVRDLYGMKFQPILTGEELAGFSQGKIADDLKIEHEHVSWADAITFIFPLWWAGMPAIAKGYIDRVLCDGFAYRFGKNGLEQLLADKKVFTITTLGDSEANYKEKGFFEAMDKLLDGITYAFAGLQSLGHLYFGQVPLVSDTERKEMLSKVREVVANF